MGDFGCLIVCFVEWDPFINYNAGSSTRWWVLVYIL